MKHLASEGNHIFVIVDKLGNTHIAEVYYDPESKGIQPPLPQQITDRISPEIVADICTDFILRRQQLDLEKRTRLRSFAQSSNLQMSEDDRTLCDSVLRSVVAKESPGINIERMNLQNLSRQHEFFKEQKKKSEEELKELKEEGEIIKEQTERTERENIRRINLTRLILQAKGEILGEEITQLRLSYAGKHDCKNVSTISPEGFVSILPLIDERLQGHRISIPIEYWKGIFERFTGITRSRLIQDEVARLVGHFPGDWNDEQIMTFLGEDRVTELIGPRPTGPVYMQLSSVNITYALIAESHENDDFVYISPLTAAELGNINSPITLRDCVIDSVDTIELKLLRSRLGQDTDVELTKAKIIDQIAELGLLTIGDVIMILIEDIQLVYYVQRLITSDKSEVYVASLPAVASDVNVAMVFETKEEFLAKLRLKIKEPIDDDLV